MKGKELAKVVPVMTDPRATLIIIGAARVLYYSVK